MSIPKPPDIDGQKIGEAEDSETKMIIMLHAFGDGNLLTPERNAWRTFAITLEAKYKAGSRELDIKKVMAHFDSLNLPLTEFSIRKLLNKFEWEFVDDYFFIIVNGTRKYIYADIIRNAKVQKRMAS